MHGGPLPGRWMVEGWTVEMDEGHHRVTLREKTQMYCGLSDGGEKRRREGRREEGRRERRDLCEDMEMLQ